MYTSNGLYSAGIPVLFMPYQWLPWRHECVCVCVCVCQALPLLIGPGDEATQLEDVYLVCVVL